MTKAQTTFTHIIISIIICFSIKHVFNYNKIIFCVIINHLILNIIIYRIADNTEERSGFAR